MIGNNDTENISISVDDKKESKINISIEDNKEEMGVGVSESIKVNPLETLTNMEIEDIFKH